MRNGVRTASVLAVIALLALPAFVSASGASAADLRDRYIVVLEDSVEHPAAVAKRHAQSRDADLGHVYRHAVKGYSAELSKAAVEGLRNDPRVKSVTPDHVLSFFAQSTPTGIGRIFAPANETLAINEEDDIRVDADVAVIDSGVDAHEDLDVVGRTDCATLKEGKFECVNGTGADYLGHGTHVAGTVGALDNGVGVVGVAPGARIWSVRVSLTGSVELFESSAVAGVDWVAATRQDEDPENDIDVANMSFGCYEAVNCPSGLPVLDEAITEAVADGVVMVAAAGNFGHFGIQANETHPAAHPDVITVSALADTDGAPGAGGPGTCNDNFPPGATRTYADDSLAFFSNWGSAVDVAAPGGCILSTYPGGEYKTSSGTSMAAPHVTGAAAILAAQDQPESKEDAEAIRETIVEEGNSGWEDTSADEIQEPLLDVSDESVFDPTATEKWALQKPLNPGSGDRLLFDVACDQTATGDCTAVGRYTVAGAATPLVQRFTEGSWELQTAAEPAGVTQSAFDGVACPSASSCIAVGAYETASPGLLTLAEHWNGSSWSVGSTPNPKGSTANFLVGIGCSSTNACTAVGYTVVSGVRKPIAERWNGSTWTLEEAVPVPEGATSSELYAVDCSSATFCMAVGFFTNGSGKTRGFTAVWEGASWSLKGIVEPAETVESSLHDVSCVGSPAVCTAVGAWQPGPSSQYNLVERWKEGSWTLQASPSNGQASVLQSVWCRTSASCTAVGDFRTTVESPIETLALNWTGTEWLIEPTPNPPGTTFGVLVGVSCQAPTDTCRAVGWYDDSGTYKTLGEVRVGP